MIAVHIDPGINAEIAQAELAVAFFWDLLDIH